MNLRPFSTSLWVSVHHHITFQFCSVWRHVRCHFIFVHHLRQGRHFFSSQVKLHNFSWDIVFVYALDVLCLRNVFPLNISRVLQAMFYIMTSQHKHHDLHPQCRMKVELSCMNVRSWCRHVERGQAANCFANQYISRGSIIGFLG